MVWGSLLILLSYCLFVSASVSFDEGFSHLFGDGNLMIRENVVHLSLDKRTGSGFVSQEVYSNGRFSASIKLPADYTAGVVVAFYMSNGEVFEKNHDEIDFEFLGNIRGKDWRIQTNIYGNGSTSTGREERYTLWFDPSEDFHQYTILWTDTQIIFYVDEIPIREVKRTPSMGGDFPSKPMSVYATIWDGSGWATNGGKYGVNYKYAPYTSEFSDFVLHGCAVDPMEQLPVCDKAYNGELAQDITLHQRLKMQRFRSKFLTYSYCYDRTRYKVPPPECVIIVSEEERLKSFDPVRFGGAGARRRRAKRRHQTS